MFAQPDLERVLDARARALPSVDGRSAAPRSSISRRRPTTLRSRSPRRPARAGAVAAKWVVGCDGTNSFVRGALGATVTDLGFFFDWLIVDVLPHAPKVWRPLNIQVCDPRRPTTLVSGGPGTAALGVHAPAGRGVSTS